MSPLIKITMVEFVLTVIVRSYTYMYLVYKDLRVNLIAKSLGILQEKVNM